MIVRRMNPDPDVAFVAEVMTDFAHLTGLDGNDPHPRRYLWTDAFAVCNFLELFTATGDRHFRTLAVRLVDQVHYILGRHREDDSRSGWISGLDEPEGQRHPTAGGLRIGKPLNERKPQEPPDERLEWDRDGQYYHYLTKWMHALNCMSRETADPTYIKWSAELAKTAHARFAYAPFNRAPKRMYWKMSIDLSYPLVSSMGQHDPLDGFVTYQELQAALAGDFAKSPPIDLKDEIADIAGICRGIRLDTEDPLGIGGLLFDGYRISQLIGKGVLIRPELLERILESALTGLETFIAGGSLMRPPEFRLAFRELGLSIGLSGLEKMQAEIEQNPDLFQPNDRLKRLIEDFRDYVPIGNTIKQFWMAEENREAVTWKEHREINMVMLATGLAPGIFLTI